MTIEQTDFDNDYEGLMTECPFCTADETGYKPKPYLSSGSCHECGREFEVVVRWDEDE